MHPAATRAPQSRLVLVEDRTHDERKYRMLNVIDEFTHECLAIRVARKLKAIDVIDALSDLFILRGAPGHIRSEPGPRRASGPAVVPAAGGRTRDRTRPMLQQRKKALARAPSTRDPKQTSTELPASANGGLSRLYII